MLAFPIKYRLTIKQDDKKIGDFINVCDTFFGTESVMLNPPLFTTWVTKYVTVIGGEEKHVTDFPIDLTSIKSRHFIIAEENEEKTILELAAIEFEPILSTFLYSIRVFDSDHQQKVETFLRKIISKAEELGFEIVSVEPPELLEKPLSSKLKPWEKIPDHSWDRELLRLWLLTYSAKDIAQRLKSFNVHEERVTNRISELRRIYGLEIVPTDAQRKEGLIKGNSDKK